jgi:hypothetical protein
VRNGVGWNKLWVVSSGFHITGVEPSGSASTVLDDTFTSSLKVLHRLHQICQHFSEILGSSVELMFLI